MDERLGGGLLENQADDSETGVAKWVGGYVSLQELMRELTGDGKLLMRQVFFGGTVKERELMESQGEGGGDCERVKWARFEGQCRIVG